MLALIGGSFWMPQEASTYAGNVDWIFYFILGVSAFFFGIIVVLLILFSIRYHRPEGSQPEPSPTHSNALEMAWSIIPIILIYPYLQKHFATGVRIGAIKE